MLNTKKLKQILSRYNIQINRTDEFLLAMTHSSFANEHKLESNERIEFLGDAVLGLLVATYIYNNFPKMTEGAMSKLRATYVCESANAKYAKELEIDKLLLLGCGEEKTGGREKDAIINDAFEAFLGALYLTNGLADVKKIEFIDYKSRLQEFVQSETRNNLEYVEIKKEGPTNNPKFTMNVVLEGIILGTGVGGNKKSAQQAAAKDALAKVAKAKNN